MLQNYKMLFDFMEVLGKKWVVPLLLILLICRESNFSNLKKQLKITSRALSKKLKILEAIGLVERIIIENPKKICYTLSKKGEEVSGALMQFSGRF